eukprot:448558-Pyramimonas_sp.AAC.1
MPQQASITFQTCTMQVSTKSQTCSGQVSNLTRLQQVFRLRQASLDHASNAFQTRSSFAGHAVWLSLSLRATPLAPAHPGATPARSAQ